MVIENPLRGTIIVGVKKFMVPFQKIKLILKSPKHTHLGTSSARHAMGQLLGTKQLLFQSFLLISKSGESYSGGLSHLVGTMDCDCNMAERACVTDNNEIYENCVMVV